MDEKQLTTTATVHAPIHAIWEYWSGPEHIMQWNFATADWHCPHAEIDLRPGGRYKVRMEARDGSFGFDFEGAYDEVIPEKLIAHTMSDGRPVRSSFEDLSGAVKITTVFTAETQTDPELQRMGWQAILNNFKRYAEAQSRL